MMMKKICYVFLFLFGVINMNGMNSMIMQNPNLISPPQEKKVLLPEIALEVTNEPQVLTCPYCGQTVRTIVEEKTDCKSFFCCIVTLGIGWGIRKAIKYPNGTWISTVTHSCPNCSKVMGVHDPWK